ncbi:hypothetical protein [Actinoalloteichus hymeniacidonis]|uniref:Uncharacterized protein n=1 Tax=Actinoalloteichus hymeniacidonis TaxID=340345 RepID=A0AAC9MWI3_9PSEU|nr:hypothetical protein [Actinoalloteichus hymeniacidonis]AOS60872.1 hypothetical protein TL08_00110 [Actinoalloteichus hymeniacidonis]MBB5911128.1 hypothetical protein [Actinoalloteichus hymeniacidonis]
MADEMIPSAERALPEVTCRDIQGRTCLITVRVVDDRIELSSPASEIIMLEPDSIRALGIVLRGAVARVQARIRARSIPLPSPRRPGGPEPIIGTL